MYNYEFIESDYNYIDGIAIARNDAKAAGSSRKYDKASSDIDIHVLGLLGELAFCRIANVVPSFDARPYGDLYDLELVYGIGKITVEVKSRSIPDGDLATRGVLRADIGVLMLPLVSDNPHRPLGFRFAGWTTKLHFLRTASVKYLAGPRYVIEADKLLPPQLLLRQIRI